MATMNLSLPETMQQWVDGQADTGGYDDASDYVRALIRRDQERAGKIAAMRRLIEEAEASGIGTMTMDEIRAEGLRRAGIRAV